MTKKKPNPKKKSAAKAFKAQRQKQREIKGIAPGRDEDRKAFIRTLPCFVCELQSRRQTSKTEAAHLGDEKDGRGLRQKADDSTVGPLCREHHTKDPLSHHRLGVRFWDWLGLKREDVIARFQRAYKKYQKEHPVAAESVTA